MFVYLVTWLSSEGMNCEVFGTRKDAEQFCAGLNTEHKNGYIVEKAVRSTEYIGMVFGG
jgi:hypothetical protein